MNIVKYSPSRAKEITELFYSAVHSIDPNIYSEKEKTAWAPYPIDYTKWHKRLESKKPYMLIIDQQVAGFIELEDDGHIYPSNFKMQDSAGIRNVFRQGID